MQYNPGYIDNEPKGNEGISWLDYIIINNPNGVMSVLAKYGYVGYLAPQNQSELKEAALIFIQKYEDRAIIDLLRIHPDYDIIKETPETGYSTEKENFNNFSKDATKTKTKINYEKGLLIIGGLLIIASYIK